MQKKKGISLIVLVITIIVIIILAGSVILSLSNNNPITQATEASYKVSVDAYNSELNMTMSNLYVSNAAFDANAFNVPAWDGVSSTTGTIKQYIISMSDADAKKFEIQNGKLVYIGADSSETIWNAAVNVTKEAPLFTKTKPQVSDVNKYKTPYIPTGFTYKEGKWNSGLVIQDAVGNEFVWIPVDGINVPYAKWCNSGIAYNDSSIIEDTLPTGITNELDQITNYGGFYIARYETGKEGATTLVSKKSAVVWNNINYTDAKTKSESMYNTTSVSSGLVTGKQWDTTLEWIKDSGKDVADSKTWGNYPHALAPANIAVCGIRQATGFSEYWKANNIYDLAGNVWEWTTEKYTTSAILRGGGFVFYAIPQDHPVAYRHAQPITSVLDNVAFRVVLYIK